MFALILGWGGNWPASKIALSEFSPLLLRSLTLSLGGAGLLLLAGLRRHSLRIEREDAVHFAIQALLMVTVWQTCATYGIQMMPAGRAAIIGNTIPIWVALLGVWALREPFTIFTALGLLFGIAGLGVLIGPDIVLVRAAPLGASLMLLAALSVASATVHLKRRRWRTPLTVLTGWSVLLGGLPIYIGAVVTGAGTYVGSLSPAALGGAAYNVVVATIFAYWAWYKLVGLFPATTASMVAFVIPIVGVGSSAVLLDEPLGVRELGSLALVLGGLGSVLFGRALWARMGTR
jgi:drug/metabolite transporter (DMT)-like permease